ncbi:MAG: thioredoxin family protein [Bacteroidetes bacterium]|nr:thioredoxin family protein [Bacteroidota bacterium]
MMIFVYIILGLIALFLSMQFIMVFAAKRTKGKKLNGLSGKLKSLEKNGSAGLVYFFSPSCRACKMQTPVIKDLQKNYKNVFDVDISKDLQTARIFGVKATPTTVAVKDGLISKVFVGFKQQDIIEKQLMEMR